MFVGCAPAILRPSGLLSALRPQDVFATSLYTGTGASRTITTGLDLASQGSLVWSKNRSVAADHYLYDTIRGQNALFSNTTGAEANTGVNGVSSLSSTGYSIGANGAINGSGNNIVGWSFRRASKFIDIVTHTGDGTSGRVIPHALGIKPGMIIVKRRDSAVDWCVYHISRGAGSVGYLNLTNAFATGAGQWNNTEPTASDFTLGSGSGVNAAGATYVAYLIAHDPDTTNGIVRCGNFTTDGNGNASVALGWPLQWILIKATNGAADWFILDTARGTIKALYPNTSGVENNGGNGFSATSTGFNITGYPAGFQYVYLAIRAPI